jgi:hypothetical protein
MRTYLKEIIISAGALLLMILAIVAYLKVVKNEQSNLESDIYTLIPPNAEALLAVNRPDIFNRMMLKEPILYQAFASEIPEIFLSIIRSNQRMQSVVFSFHPQGTLCCMQAGRITHALEEEILPGHFKPYAPQKQTFGGIDFFYYPDTENHFFGYYVYKGLWVGSYSRKLLERAAAQQQAGKVLLPEEMRRLTAAFDANSPASIVYPARELGLYGEEEDEEEDEGETPTDIQWVAADLFVNEGNICFYAHLPFFNEETADNISARIALKYPFLDLSFQVADDEDSLFITACSPLYTEENPE